MNDNQLESISEDSLVHVSGGTFGCGGLSLSGIFGFASGLLSTLVDAKKSLLSGLFCAPEPDCAPPPPKDC